MGSSSTLRSSPTLLKRILKGESLRLRGAAHEDRIVMAEWISEAVRQGVRIDLSHAIIRGVLDVKYATFEDEVRLIKCLVEERADFSCTTFKSNLLLYGTRFQSGANFDSATMLYDARLNRTEFASGEASFVDIHVKGNLCAKRAVFAEGVKTNFSRARIEKAAIFCGVIFEGEVDFDHAYIAGEGDFRGAVFKRKVNFNPARIEGGLLFRAQPERNLPAATFAGQANFGYVDVTFVDFTGARFHSKGKPVSFQGAKINGLALFNSTQFDCGDKAVNFYGAHIEGPAFFTASSFASDASFNEVQIAGSAYFIGVQFQKNASFNGSSIGHDAFFGADFQAGAEPKLRRTVFDGVADFTGVHIRGSADFRGAEFRKRASFNSAKIGYLAHFGDEPQKNVPAATFKSEVDFTAAEIGSYADFSGTEFLAADKLVSFDSANVGASALFRGAVFAGPVQFSRTHIEDVAAFGGVTFRKRATFNSARIGAAAFFDPDPGLGAATFDDGADFAGVNISSVADFRTVKFTSTETVTFEGAKIGSQASFSGAHFVAPVSFVAAKIDGRALFDSVIFDKGTSFEGVEIGGNAYFNEAKFLKSSTSFARKVHPVQKVTRLYRKSGQLPARTLIESQRTDYDIRPYTTLR